MKKFYINLFVLGFAAFASSSFIAQTDADYSPSQLTQEEKNNLINSTQVLQNRNVATICPTTDTLGTPLLSGNGQAGNMFDVTVGPNDITVKTFWISHDFDDQVSIYYKSGTFVGSESTPGNWTYLDSGFVAANGNGLTGVIPVDIALTLSAGQTYAFYVTDNNQGSFNYTNGTAVGDTLVSNADVTIFQGNGGGFFSVTYTPRDFNGKMEYCVVSGAGIDDLNSADLNIYPNPANTELNIDLSNLSIDRSSVVIYNILGESVLSKSNLSVSSTNTLDISHLTSGVYLVSLKAGDMTITKKVLVD